MSSEEVSLHARVEALGDAFDLLAAYGGPGFLFDHGGLGVATSGPLVATAPPSAAARMLSEIDGAIGGGGRTVAVGAMPFASGSPGASVRIATRTVRRSSGSERRVTKPL